VLVPVAVKLFPLPESVIMSALKDRFTLPSVAVVLIVEAFEDRLMLPLFDAAVTDRLLTVPKMSAASVVMLAELSATALNVKELFASVAALVTVKLLLFELSDTALCAVKTSVTSPSLVLAAIVDAEFTSRFTLPVSEVSVRLPAVMSPVMSAAFVVIAALFCPYASNKLRTLFESVLVPVTTTC
jgi:hypothetical protein